jgi:uncharacterized repeat protein (TIGR01451 family)
MPFIASLARARSLTLCALVATAICLTLTASPLFNPASAAPEGTSSTENVQVFAGDCRTPQTTFYLGDTVCVRTGEFPLHPTAAELYRRINWAAPDLGVAETELVFADPEYDKFVIPTSGPFAQPGRWRVQTVDIETNARANATFIVRHPRYFFADMIIWKQGPDWVLPGDRIRYELTIRNSGPEYANGVQFAEDVPSNATFLALKQRTGSPFECQVPKEGDIGRILCSTRGMKLDEEAVFDVYYVVNREAREGDTCEGRTQVASQNDELNKYNNLTRYTTLIASPFKEDPPPSEEQENQTGGDPPKDVPEPEPVNPPGMPTGPTPPPEPENPPGMPTGPTPPPEEENPW